jgi:hypothetical protein
LLSLFRGLPAAVVIDVLLADFMPRVGAPGAKLAKLVLRVLTFVVGRDARVDGYPHALTPVREKGSSTGGPPNPRKIRDLKIPVNVIALRCYRIKQAQHLDTLPVAAFNVRLERLEKPQERV